MFLNAFLSINSVLGESSTSDTTSNGIIHYVSLTLPHVFIHSLFLCTRVQIVFIFNHFSLRFFFLFEYKLNLTIVSLNVKIKAIYTQASDPRRASHYLTPIILDTIIFHATTATMLEGSEESSAQQIVVAFEKRTPKSDLCLAASFTVERQPYTLLAHEYQSTECPDSGKRDTKSAWSVFVDR